MNSTLSLGSIPAAVDHIGHLQEIGQISADQAQWLIDSTITGRNLLSVDADAKTSKGTETVTGILYLAPAGRAFGNRKINGKRTLCAMASIAGCEKPCLNTSGKGRLSSVQLARLRKTLAYLFATEWFKSALVRSIRSVKTKAAKAGKPASIRLNGTSDISIENEFADILEVFPEVMFYDYTKNTGRDVSSIPNYHLSQSYSEASPAYAAKAIREAQKRERNLIAVVRVGMVEEFRGFETFDADKSDERFLDATDKVRVGVLKPKGDAKKDVSGFVCEPDHAASIAA